jgi:hypothetical protein
MAHEIAYLDMQDRNSDRSSIGYDQAEKQENQNRSSTLIKSPHSDNEYSWLCVGISERKRWNNSPSTIASWVKVPKITQLETTMHLYRVKRRSNRTTGEVLTPPYR